MISLGPYILNTVISSAKAFKSLTNFSGKGSPPNTIFLTKYKDESGSLLSYKIFIRLGVTVITSVLYFFISLSSNFGFLCSALLAITIL